MNSGESISPGGEPPADLPTSQQTGVASITSSGTTETTAHDQPTQQLQILSVQIVALIENVLAAVVAAHKRGIMHCDLKPNNLVVVRVPREETLIPPGTRMGTHVEVLKLCDFGVARQMREEATHLSEGVGWGTAQYMAPEMVHTRRLDGHLRVSLAVDVWAMGVILHQLLHDSKTPHEHLLRRGRVRLFLGIADEKSAKVLQTSRCLLTPEDNVPPQQKEQRTAEQHDFLISLQNACLRHNAKDRPDADELLQVSIL